MDAEKLRTLVRAYPFKPFVLVLDDGRRFVVDKPGFMGVSPIGNLVVVASGDDKMEMLKPEWISDAVTLDNVKGSAGPGEQAK